MQNCSIHWFRRDLRLAGNALFFQQVKKYQGRVLGIFIFDPTFLSRPDFSHARFDFFLNSLKELRLELKELGSDLLILDKGPEVAWKEILAQNIKFKIETISFNRDYEPFARNRDEKAKKLFSTYGVKTETGRDHLIIEPHELHKDDGSYYKVFTPFAKKWKSLFLNLDLNSRIKNSDWLPVKGKQLCSHSWCNILPSRENPSLEILNRYQNISQKKHQISLPAAGHQAGLVALKIFKPKLNFYAEQRDLPAKEGTSRFSMYLKNGTLTTAQVIKQLKLFGPKETSGQDKFLNEIIWREFYYHLIFHEPNVEKMPFQKKYTELKWENNYKYLQAWKNGMTGFPIVDAGMRQLKQTGWIHNRVRMIVASFLCKDLLINYQEGERHFMQYLLDGDLAVNNGGWQWAASTGCDAQPYFRIFNPWTQGQRFDSEASYIKKYVPELCNDSAKTIHQIDGSRSKNYPKPIVSHEIQRVLALKIYTQH